MPSTPHTERHFNASDNVRDVVIGMADGLTVPFALAAGLSGAVAQTGIIVTAGLAEIAAGAIAMGLGGYLAARTDFNHYHAEYGREMRETHEMPEEELKEVRSVFEVHGLTGHALDQAVEAISSDRVRWVEFMMKFELGLDRPNARRAPISAATIALSYLVGGLVPLLPYMLMARIDRAFGVSVAVTLMALFLFGAIKGRLTGAPSWVSGFQTLIVGSLAAGAAYCLARLIT